MLAPHSLKLQVEALLSRSAIAASAAAAVELVCLFLRGSDGLYNRRRHPVIVDTARVMTLAAPCRLIPSVYT
jgi:hypothetical protein